ncbi:MAG TPA: CheR family methyltransferase, partial [Myxococcales bacterium]
MKRDARRPDEQAAGGSRPAVAPFPIAGIGASAGGLEAFSQLLGLLPTNMGMAFVLIQHLDPNHPSYLIEALAKTTAMSCQLIEDGMVVAPDRVYVIPPNVEVGILKGVFTLFGRTKGEHPPARAVDFFFRALAADQGNKAIGMVLSGTGTDGTEGLRAIKAEDGLTFAQEPSSAKFSGMPASAIASGIVDFVGPVPELVRELARVGGHPYVRSATPGETPGAPPEEGDDFRRILFLLRSQVGVDFSDYKPSTIRRRLARRMALRQQMTLRDYLGLLQGEPAEVRALHEDLLVNVTSFFRDPEVWESLRETVLPEIVKSKPAGGAIRVWVPGCSTGEEAYSVAICLLEVLQANVPRRTVQIFATDISDKAIAAGRAGFFSEGAVRDVSPARLQTFFTRVEGGYQINKSVRDLCVFVRHNLVNDPPFSKLDLVSCRNLLIYFNHVLQARAIATFHFALQVPGFLLVGKSEGVVDSSGLFSQVDKESNLYARSRTASTLRFAAAPRVGTAAAQPAPAGLSPAAPQDLLRQAENLLLGHYVPPGVVVNDQGEILQFRGHTGPYLEHAPGQPHLTLLKMAREGLLADLQIALAQARKTHSTARRSGVRVRQDGRRTVECDVVVTPLPGPPGLRERAFIVLFEKARPAEVPRQRRGEARDEPGGAAAVKAGDRRIAELEADLKATKDYLQAIADEHQRTNDELTTANEELISSNEELQSLNEELETAKEELQSTNEELVTLNDELQLRNSELNTVNGDLLNVMNSVEIPVVIVDGARRIRRFTPKAV